MKLLCPINCIYVVPDFNPYIKIDEFTLPMKILLLLKLNLRAVTDFKPRPSNFLTNFPSAYFHIFTIPSLSPDASNTFDTSRQRTGELCYI